MLSVQSVQTDKEANRQCLANYIVGWIGNFKTIIRKIT